MMSAAVASSGWSFGAIGTRISNFFSSSTTGSSLIDIKIVGGESTLADVVAHLQKMDWNWGYDAVKLILMARIAQTSYSRHLVFDGGYGGYGWIGPQPKQRCREVLSSFGTMLCAVALIETAGNLRNWDTSKLLESVVTTAALSTVDGAASFRLVGDIRDPLQRKLRRWSITTLASLWFIGRIGYQNPVFAKAMNPIFAKAMNRFVA